MRASEPTNAYLENLMKLRLLTLKRWSIGNDLSQPLASRKSKISRVTTRAVNRLAATPIVSVTPKPLMGPVPM